MDSGRLARKMTAERNLIWQLLFVVERLLGYSLRGGYWLSPYQGSWTRQSKIGFRRQSAQLVLLFPSRWILMREAGG